MPTNSGENKPITPPKSVSDQGAINPSSPTSGTEGYGMQQDEPDDFTGRNPTASHPGAKGAGDVRNTSYPMPEGSRHMENESRQDALKNNPNNRMGKQFRCSELGMAACNWSVTGNDESDMMPKIEQHGREAHGINDMDDNLKRRVRDAIHDRAA